MPAVNYPKTHGKVPMAKTNAMTQDQRMTSGVFSRLGPVMVNIVNLAGSRTT